MKCILISLPSRSAIALLESPAMILTLVSSGVLSHPIFTELSKLNSTSLMKFYRSSSKVVAVIFNAATHSSINFLGLEHGPCPRCMFWHSPRISPWIFFEFGCHERWSSVGMKILTFSHWMILWRIIGTFTSLRRWVVLE
ncbi:UNVERIFIED_CONTAM: hypothetical protein Slati_2677600 [Sesamum latifolium]|uniref:Secreted protein n=1 Tax=Sesamum latifolium TaxID=2727402 RepID=A0AAW2VVG9_9LAMI